MWVPGHVGIRGNTIVDQAAKDALHMTIPNLPKQSIPYSDLKRQTSVFCRKLWQEEWSSQTNNKLFQICPDLSDPLPLSLQNRKEQTVLCRLHIGHTYITHSFLLRGEEIPWCHACDSSLSVRHILTECTDITAERKRFLNTRNLTSIFRNVSLSCIFQFLKCIGLYHKI